ncbi:MAG: hypothetical protein JAZ11_12960 [Candidatus Thiodiazotropha lotti]|nr:hypothetical protein [Candidatus Thiodiazotropha lotti]
MASVTLTAHWSDEQAFHEEWLHAGKFSIWREVDRRPPDNIHAGHAPLSDPVYAAWGYKAD